MTVPAVPLASPMHAAVPHVFSLRWQPGQLVELAGDITNFASPLPMPEVSPGLYRLELRLTPGAYRYKFRVNRQQWVDDPQAELHDWADGFTNALVIVGGLTGPIRFAPDRRHLVLDQDGRLIVQAEVTTSLAVIVILLNSIASSSSLLHSGFIPLYMKEVLLLTVFVIPA